MKKQLTILAAAAILASFATVALAAPANVTMGGSFLWNAEYQLAPASADPWTNDSDVSLANSAADFYINFAAAVAGPPALSVSWDLNRNNASHNSVDKVIFDPALTLTGTVGGATVKLGNVSYCWDNISGALGGNAGAEVSKTIGKLSVDAITGSTGTGTDLTAVRFSGPVSPVTSAYGAVVLDDNVKGLAWLGGSSTVGGATLEGKYSKEIGDDDGVAFLGKATVKVSPALTFVGKVFQADSFWNLDTYNDGSGSTDSLYFDATLTPDRANGLNVYLEADDAWATGATAYVKYDGWAQNQATNNNTTVGTSYAPMYVTDAHVTIGGASSTFVSTFAKGLWTAGAAYDTKAGNAGFLKLTKTFDWLTAYAAIRKGWAVNFTDGYSGSVPFAAVVGASASVAF